MFNKVLLLQGPLDSKGINFLTPELCGNSGDHVFAQFDTRENIRALSYIFRNHGYRIVYSGWEEDRLWLSENSQLFDAVCVNNQDNIPNTCEFFGKNIQNNKEKLYFSIYQGLLEIQRKISENCLVLRLRSDVAVDIRQLEKFTPALLLYQDSIIIEYAKTDNTYFVPDFLTVASLDTHLRLYKNLIEICKRQGGYHISSHIDHGLEFLNMQLRGELSEVICMGSEVHNSIVWRGIPRYYANLKIDTSNVLLFDCLIKYPNGANIDSVIKSIHPELLGKRN
jgi:hypothetical protein